MTDIVLAVLCLGLIVAVTSRRSAHSAGLLVAYGAALFLNHGFGAIMHALPWVFRPDTATTALGFHATMLGMVAFTAGGVISNSRFSRAGQTGPGGLSVLQNKRLGLGLVILGMIFFGVIKPLVSLVPGLAALTSCGVYLVVVGLIVVCLAAGWIKDGGEWPWLGISVLGLPAVTVVFMGFAGYGTVAAMVVLLTVVSQRKRPWFSVGTILAVFFVGVNLYINYMKGRDDIREKVWGGAGLVARLDSVQRMLTNFEPLDWHNPDHLELIDLRLNQNALVGAAMENLKSGGVAYAKGETLWFAVVALIPRIIWPSKPVVGGSGDLVTIYTGIPFAESTSVGIGHVMEFYINFGTAGVLVGFALLGMLLGWIDARAGYALARRDGFNFLCWFLPGLTWLQVGGQLVESTVACAGAVVVSQGVKWFYRQTNLLSGERRRGDREGKRQAPAR